MNEQPILDRVIQAVDVKRRGERSAYRDLVEDDLLTILDDAGTARDVNQELGAVRFALAKLLAEETDPRHLANGVSRLVAAAARLVTTREALRASDDDTNDFMLQVPAMAIASDLVREAFATPGGLDRLAAWMEDIPAPRPRDPANALPPPAADEW